MDQKILDNLKKYDNLTKSTLCLECGYQGPMGIKESRSLPVKTQRWITFWFIFSIVSVVIFHGVLNIISLIIGGIAFSAMKLIPPQPHVLSCPNCEKDLFVKS